ncbi:signal transduction histidine kinase [Glaciihabitans sp. GrIS 2.15]|nr:signal transduction histidine kinase [Glaciihabitans sp. GrIS 2.15]
MESCRVSTQMLVMAAKGGLPSPGSLARQPHNPISRPQIETVVSRSVAIFGSLFGLQAVPAMLQQIPAAQTVWAIVFGAGIYGGILATLVASFAKRWVRVVNAYVSFAYLAALIGWPLVVLEPLAVATERPWLWLLCTVATSTAAIAFSTWQATAYLIVAPVVYGLVRITPGGGGATWQSASFDIAYAVILGGAVLILITLLRQAAASVDSAQGTALDRYAHAVRQHATEVERVHVDSIVHDSVLTTLLSAARSFTPEAKDLATRMSLNAMGHLKDAAAASPDDDATVALTQLARRIADATTTLSGPFELRTRRVGSGSIPLQCSEAVYSATMQAMINSLQHAGTGDDVHRWLVVEGAEGGGIRIGIGDDGAGFAFDTVPSERLGLRVSIIERVANAGGSVEVDAGIDRGAVIWITWPRALAPDPDPTAVDTVSSSTAPTREGQPL